MDEIKSKKVCIIEAKENSSDYEIISEIKAAISDNLAVVLNTSNLKDEHSEEKIIKFIKNNFPDKYSKIAEHIYVASNCEIRK